MKDISDIRVSYQNFTMKKTALAEDPIHQFQVWMEEALKTDLREPNAFTLSTADAQGRPAARVMLLKDVDHNGFVFFTNYDSKKGRHLAENPYAAISFFWSPLERQVRIEGVTEKLDDKSSDEYFNSRPVGSRIGAHASPQSSVIPDREFLDTRVEEFSKKFPGENIPRPSNWGGFVLKPYLIEFWQGRPNRLHDRILYTLTEDGSWKIERLAP